MPFHNVNCAECVYVWRCIIKRVSVWQTQRVLFKLQSAYRKFHSSETALLYVQNDIFASLDAGHSTALLLLDLSAAFDTIDHSILIHRLQHWFGISSTALNLLSSFLSDRFQTVITPTSKSNPVLLEYGVPQGSVLGPLLYSLYTTPLHSIISKYPGLRCHFYADDTSLLQYIHVYVLLRNTQELI